MDIHCSDNNDSHKIPENAKSTESRPVPMLMPLKGSVIVIDPKGMRTAVKPGRRTFVFDPFVGED